MSSSPLTRHIVSQLAHVELLTPDLERSSQFFTEFLGLTESGRTAESRYLRAWGEAFHHSLKLTQSSQAGLGHVGWRTDSATILTTAAEYLERAGVGIGWITGDQGHGRAYRFRTPGGHVGELFWDVERYQAPETRRSRFSNRPQRRPSAGAAIRFLHHVNLGCTDVARNHTFFTDLLGFKCNEIIQVPGVGLEIFTGLACTNVDHDLGLTIDPEGKAGQLNHLAYALDSREEVLLAADAATEAGLTIELGPTKHGVGDGFFFYVHEPGGAHRIEVYSGGYLNFEPDRPPVRWFITDVPNPMLAWGGTAPESFGGGDLAGRLASLRTGQRHGEQ